MSNKDYCNICMTVSKEENIAYCALCLDAGQICGECLLKWSEAGHDPRICTICKRETMRNIPWRVSPLIRIPTISITLNLTTPIAVMECVQQGILGIYVGILFSVGFAWAGYLLYICWQIIFTLVSESVSIIGYVI